MIAGMMLTLSTQSTWGQQTWNPTASDEAENTAGGSAAFAFSDGSDNTAFGIAVLGFNTGDFNTARYKRDIAPMGSRSAGVLELRPVTFTYKDDEGSQRQYGLVAEEVATVYPDLITRTSEGTIEGVRYLELIPMLVNELQRQHRELGELRALVNQLRGGTGPR